MTKQDKGLDSAPDSAAQSDGAVFAPDILPVLAETVLEARFSGRQVSAEQLEQLLSCASALDHMLYEQLGPLGKLRYLYLENLR